MRRSLIASQVVEVKVLEAIRLHSVSTRRLVTKKNEDDVCASIDFCCFLEGFPMEKTKLYIYADIHPI